MTLVKSWDSGKVCVGRRFFLHPVAHPRLAQVNMPIILLLVRMDGLFVERNDAIL